MKTIAEVMNREFITVKEDTSLEEILVLMKEKGIGKLPVLKDEKVVGIIRRDDLLVKQGIAPEPPILAIWDLMLTLSNDKSFQEKYKKIVAIKASEIMDKEVFKISVNDNLSEAITDMLENNRGLFIGYRKREISRNNDKNRFSKRNILKN
jgi:CBS domain-containing protein